jgi:hypothetical protein
MTTSNPATVRRADAPNTRGMAADAQPARVTAPRGGETKTFYKTTEFIISIVATIAVLLASYLVKTTDGMATTSRPRRHGCTS